MAQATGLSVDPRTPEGPATSAEDEALVVALYDVVRHSRRTLVADPLEPAAVVVLAAAARLAPARPSDLACDIRLDLSTVSRHLRNLERDGYLIRTEDPDDRRAQRIAPSTRGEHALAAVLQSRSAVVSAALSAWSDEDRTALTTLLRRLADDLDTASAARRRGGKDPA
jgi:DNA-binding MarR family transcriptional regulator